MASTYINKQIIAEVVVSTPKKNGRMNWNAIMSNIQAKLPEFEGTKKMVQDLMRTKSMNELIKEQESKAKKAKAEKAKAKKALATTAHINDDDKDKESESEVVKIEGIEKKKNKDGSESRTVDLITAKDAVDMGETEILKTLGYDPRAFKLVSSSCRKGTWEAQSHEDGIVDLHSFRLNANVKPLEVGELNSAMIRDTLKGMLEAPILHPTPASLHITGDKIAIVSIADLHLGKLAWGPECGESYDHKIAISRFNYIVNEAIKRLEKEEGIERIVFFWAQDFFHFDSIEVTTTAGTRQDTDVRWQKMFQVGIKLLQEAIIKLEKIAPVFTFRVRSNHDTQIGFFANEAIAAYFHEDANVEVDTSPAPRKYFRYGVNLFGFAHGDKEGKRISSMMPNERPQEWGATWNHEFFLGHFHSLRTFEENGVILRYLSSPTGTDAWHCESGFIGAQKAAQVFIRGKEEGPLAEYNIHVE